MYRKHSFEEKLNLVNHIIWYVIEGSMQRLWHRQRITQAMGA